jgi:hypothetical protein
VVITIKRAVRSKNRSGAGGRKKARLKKIF